VRFSIDYTYSNQMDERWIVECNGTISPFRAPTRLQPAEGGEIEDLAFVVLEYADGGEQLREVPDSQQAQCLARFQQAYDTDKDLRSEIADFIVEYATADALEYCED